MKLGADELQQIIELLDSADAFKPLVTKAIEVLRSFIGEFKEPMDDLRKWVVANRIASIRQYEAESGITHEEAVMLAMADVDLLKELEGKLQAARSK